MLRRAHRMLIRISRLLAFIVYLLASTSAVYALDDESHIANLVSKLRFEDYKQNLKALAGFGDREQGSESYDRSAEWIENKLAKAGYTVEFHEYSYLWFYARHNMYVTKVGTRSPDQMYIVSAHLDGRGGGGAADDDASGAALVLEAALALAPETYEVERSIRFIFWNNEETGADGSGAYMRNRAKLRGKEDPPGSGSYPEPEWLGMIQHDMLLFDHGLPPQPRQIGGADIDIEYQADSDFASQSKALANEFLSGNKAFSTDYPAEIGDNMAKTDSWRFENMTAAISIRENRRIEEIGEGSNPHWHKSTDVPDTYSDADYRLGFNALQMTLGTIARLAGLTIAKANDYAEDRGL